MRYTRLGLESLMQRLSEEGIGPALSTKEMQAGLDWIENQFPKSIGEQMELVDRVFTRKELNP